MMADPPLSRSEEIKITGFVIGAFCIGAAFVFGVLALAFGVI